MKQVSVLEDIFAPEGLLSKVLGEQHEWRPQQRDMARAVARVLRDSGALLVEAPTGVGKSLGYLVPAVLWAQREKRPIVISTYTRTLQDQILDKELPSLRRMIERRIRAVVLKGRSNYLCRARWDHYLGEIRGTVEAEELERVLGPWVQGTVSGDLSEAPIPSGKAAARFAASLGRICSESRFCTSGRCAAESGCFFKLSRQQAREATLIIVNHSLLMIDLLTSAAGLPEWTAVIIDEAHHLPRVAAEPLSFSVTEQAFDDVLKGLGGRGEPGITDHLRRLARGLADKNDRTDLLNGLRELEGETSTLSVLAREFWADLKAAPGFPRGDQRLRYGPGASVRSIFPASGLALMDRLTPLLQRHEEWIERTRRRGPDAGASEVWPLAEAERGLDAAREAINNMGELLTPDKATHVYWIEPATARGVALRAAPLDVGPQLRDVLFTRKEAAVLTSATLSVEGDFRHLAHKLGLPDDRFEGLRLSSPFDLQAQVAGWSLLGLPDPSDPRFAESLAVGIELLARRLERKMLVLFTSHDTLRRVESMVREPLEGRGIRLLAQGLDGGRRQLRAEFVKRGASVLLGAASFWEGVDFPGEELEILLMARLPFLVPTDPVVEAIGERLAQKGQDPFRAFHLPEALIRFRQGFGRLIRRTGDRGLFVVVDPRLETRAYGAAFKASVGIEFQVAGSWDELVTRAGEWLER